MRIWGKSYTHLLAQKCLRLWRKPAMKCHGLPYTVLLMTHNSCNFLLSHQIWATMTQISRGRIETRFFWGKKAFRSSCEATFMRWENRDRRDSSRFLCDWNHKSKIRFEIVKLRRKTLARRSNWINLSLNFHLVDLASQFFPLENSTEHQLHAFIEHKKGRHRALIALLVAAEKL